MPDDILVIDIIVEDDFTLESAGSAVDVNVPEPILAVITVDGPRGGQGPPGDGVQVFGEIPVGAKDGVNAYFTTNAAYRAGSTAVFRNGLREERGVGYLESGSGTIELDQPPLDDDDITIDYVIQ